MYLDEKIGRIISLIIKWALIIFLSFMTLQCKSLNYVDKKMKLNMVNLYDFYGDKIAGDLQFTVKGFYIESSIINDQFLGGFSLKFGEVDNDYINYNLFFSKEDSTFKVRRMFINNNFETIIQTNNFEHVVICEIENGACLLDNRTVLTTFDDLESAQKFVKEYYDGIQ